MEEVKLMKGNEVVAEAAVRCGCDGYFGYPITPQSEILETLMEMRPWESSGMTVLQAESEIASINMLYGAAASGRKAMTSSSSPGISLMSEGISYLAGAELPCLIVNVSRGGPGLGTIQPAQSDYFQTVKGGGHGDYRLIVLAPNSVQEMYDFVGLGFDLAFKYLNPVMMLSDGLIGQMMEKVVLSPQKERDSDAAVVARCGSWAAQGKPADGSRGRNVVTSLDLDPAGQQKFNDKLQAKYKEVTKNEIRCEAIECDDAEFVMVAYGSSSRICQRVVEMAREEGYKVGLLRPITLFPFPVPQLRALADRGVKGFLSVELSMGQMVEDVRLAVGCTPLVEHFGHCGGVIHSPEEVYHALKTSIIEKTR